MSSFRFLLHIIGLTCVIFLLLGAVLIQLFWHEQPCPLCLLQRIGYIAVGLGLLLNLFYGERTSHWGLIILSALCGIAVSLRQICLHITSPIGFADPVLGLHLYTWCFIGFAMVLLGSSVMLMTMTELRVMNEYAWPYKQINNK